MVHIMLDSELPERAPWRAITFDLDDTLYPEIQFVQSGFHEVANWCRENLGIASDVVYQELSGLFDKGNRGKIFDEWTEQRGLIPGTVQGMVRVYRNHHPRIEPFPGVREMLLDLRKQFRIGLLSDGSLAIQERKLSALDLTDLFDALIFSDRWGRDYWKPSSRPYLALIKALSMKPEEVVYVGDNPAKDFFACRRLGMRSIWLRQSTGIYAEQVPESAASRPDYVVESIHSLRDLLRTGLSGDPFF